MGARGGAPNGGGNPDVSERTVRVALTSGGMYDRLYERIPEFEHSTGVAVAIGFRGTHPDLNAHLAALDPVPDRKSTRLNSSHLGISYAVFCLKKKHLDDAGVLSRVYLQPRRGEQHLPHDSTQLH